MWDKLREWLLRWTDGEWKRWESMEGMVYMWISVRTGKSYVGSTKGKIMGRARSHLNKVRKVLKEWEKNGGEKRVEDEEVLEVHYEIARNPGEWAMVPISGEVEDWKRVEKRLIRWFRSELNVVGKEKKKKRERRRPLKKWREEGGEEREGKKIEKGAVSVYEIGGRKYEDLWNALKGEKDGEKIEVKWVSGVIEVTRWEKLWNERIIVKGKWGDKKIKK